MLRPCGLDEHGRVADPGDQHLLALDPARRHGRARPATCSGQAAGLAGRAQRLRKRRGSTPARIRAAPGLKKCAAVEMVADRARDNRSGRGRSERASARSRARPSRTAGPCRSSGAASSGADPRLRRPLSGSMVKPGGERASRHAPHDTCRARSKRPGAARRNRADRGRRSSRTRRSRRFRRGPTVRPRLRPRSAAGRDRRARPRGPPTRTGLATLPSGCVGGFGDGLL